MPVEEFERTQLLCLDMNLADESAASRTHQTWTAFSRAAHFHPYELPPTHEELAAWHDSVMEVIDVTEARWR